jgi:hypothetical protein
MKIVQLEDFAGTYGRERQPSIALCTKEMDSEPEPNGRLKCPFCYGDDLDCASCDIRKEKQMKLDVH